MGEGMSVLSAGIACCAGMAVGLVVGYILGALMGIDFAGRHGSGARDKSADEAGVIGRQEPEPGGGQ